MPFVATDIACEQYTMHCTARQATTSIYEHQTTNKRKANVIIIINITTTATFAITICAQLSAVRPQQLAVYEIIETHRTVAATALPSCAACRQNCQRTFAYSVLRVPTRWYNI